MEPFSFASSSALKLPVSIRINNLDGHQKPLPASVLLRRPDLKHVGSINNPYSDLHVTVQLWADSKPLTAPVQTPYKAFKNQRLWNEWLTLPINYSTIPLSSQLAITVWDVSPAGGAGTSGHAIPFGGTTIPLFDKDNTLLKGRQRCHVHRFKAADGLSSSTTPFILPLGRHDQKKKEQSSEDAEIAELERLEDLMKKHEMGEITENKWLDQLVFRHIEQLQHSVSKKLNENSEYFTQSKDMVARAKSGAPLEECIDPGQFFLYIDFPRFDHPIVFTDYEYPAPPISTLQPQKGSVPDVQLKPPPDITLGPGINDETQEAGRLIRIFDPETGVKENPVENKYRRLTRINRDGTPDRDAKPSAKERDELSLILSYGPTQELTPSEMDLVWRFRYHLSRNKRALTKFIKSVHWTQPREARQAVQMLPKWTEIDVDDALELLGPTITNTSVRAYAVDRLRKSDDDELQLYLLQLVQALKFERPEDSDAAPEDAAQDSSLAKFLIARAAKSLQLGNFLHWFLMVECDDTSPGQTPIHRKLFAKVEYDFMVELMDAPDGPARRKTLLRQGELILVLSRISKEVRFSKEDRLRKIERLKRSIAAPENDLLTFDPPLPLPLDPTISITGVVPEASNVFKSSLFPLLVKFKTSKGGDYSIIFKTGDDLRQDQLVIQIILLMDRLLRKENLDLKLSPYRILATATTAGAVQFVPSSPLAAIVAKYKGAQPLLAYLRANNPSENEPLGVRREAMDNYVKSCAGYCVITYLLGVGDRHLDNLLVTPDGHFFHADFGYILGRDPKPFAPLMKLSKEMIEGMGGANSPHYLEFKQHCFTAYTTLRKSANLILNLFALMSDANIPDIKMEPDKAVEKVRERFHLELRTEDEVVRLWEGLMEDSVGSVVAGVIDWTHGFAQRFRA
ncbi:hypothetical protein FH972_026141 [Carpinus fangiana]|uniref:phosphatidylinositol 3-kinase n=1 Tax=Carpinus fangiana TaxID=176857 RepID=A0A5N6L3F7_9ROSI|nr:hypothetical protein FH972_026141 [Carpinus fangiana]